MLAPQRPRWLCPLCGRLIVHAHFKRHVSSHERSQRFTRDSCDRAWLAFVDHSGYFVTRPVGGVDVDVVHVDRLIV